MDISTFSHDVVNSCMLQHHQRGCSLITDKSLFLHIISWAYTHVGRIHQIMDLFVSVVRLACLLWERKKNNTVSWKLLMCSHQRPRCFRTLRKMFKKWLKYHLKSSLRNARYELYGQMLFFGQPSPAQPVNSLPSQRARLSLLFEDHILQCS